MKQIVLLLNLLFLSLTCLSQSNTDGNTPKHDFASLNELLASSDIIDNQTFDFKFLIRALPDHGWYLKLNEDASYEYIHWSGWEDSEGTILEKGEYVIAKNKIKLDSYNKTSELAKTQFYLVTSETNEADNNITIDCLELNSKTYCLYQKGKKSL